MTNKKGAGEENIRDYHLASKQKIRIRDKNALSDASVSPGRYLREIRKNKVEKIPERIDRLFTDIRLLAEIDFFTEDWEAEVWEQVNTTDDDWSSWDWEPYLEELLFEQQHDFDSREPPISSAQDDAEAHPSVGPTDFGIELGHTLRLLCHSHLSRNEQLDLLVGIFMGLMQPEPTTRYPGDKGALEDQLKFVDDFEQKLKAWVLTDSLTRQSAGSLQTNVSFRRNIIYVCIDSAGLTASPPLIEHLLEKVDFPSIKNEQTDEDRMRAQREVEDHLQELTKSTEIDRIEDLIEAVSKSIKLLVSMQGDVEEILSKIYSSNGVSYREIDYEGKNLKVVMTLLAGDHEHSDRGKYREWTQRPLVQRISKDWEATKWETTEFGTLVGYIIDTEKSPGWLHRYILEKDNLTSDDIRMIDRAMSELDI